MEPVPLDEARAATAAFPGWRQHAFPTCFTCGTDRAEGDGLRVFPGPDDVGRGAARAGGVGVDAAPEHHRGLARVRRRRTARQPVGVAWAALDCSGGWAAASPTG